MSKRRQLSFMDQCFRLETIKELCKPKEVDKTIQEWLKKREERIDQELVEKELSRMQKEKLQWKLREKNKVTEDLEVKNVAKPTTKPIVCKKKKTKTKGVKKNKRKQKAKQKKAKEVF